MHVQFWLWWQQCNRGNRSYKIYDKSKLHGSGSDLRRRIRDARHPECIGRKPYSRIPDRNERGRRVARHPTASIGGITIISSSSDISLTIDDIDAIIRNEAESKASSSAWREFRDPEQVPFWFDLAGSYCDLCLLQSTDMWSTPTTDCEIPRAHDNALGDNTPQQCCICSQSVERHL